MERSSRRSQYGSSSRRRRSLIDDDSVRQSHAMSSDEGRQSFARDLQEIEERDQSPSTWRCWEPKIFGRSQKPKKKVGKPILWMCIMETFVFAFFTPYKLHCAISVYKHKTTYNIF